MDIFRSAERLMAMDEAAWARHANPWSVLTRATCLPLIALALWSRVWLGWWALVPVAAALVWTWANPRLFAPVGEDDPPPAHWIGRWASDAVHGERRFLARRDRVLPDHHVAMARLLAAASALGLLPLLWGLAALDPWATICGVVATGLSKLWFCDRMVWLYREETGTGRGEDWSGRPDSN